MKNKRYQPFVLCILYLVLCTSSLFAQKNAPSYDISVSVTDAQTKEPIIMGTVQLNPLGQYAVTDVKGKAVIKNIPQGTYTLSVTYVGYETYTTNIAITNKNLDLSIRMEEASLALKEVSVTAKQNAAGTSTASIIGRQAIDHLQASSLADIMQLVPGQLMGHKDMMSEEKLQLRVPNSAAYDNTAAFGTTVVVDGVPMSNNGIVTQITGSLSADGTGTDLRNIAADDINEVEVVRGIPSAEYGDLTSGMVIVHSKAGVTPLQLKSKVNPALINASVSKGENFGKAGIFNASFDYAQAWGDPRNKSKSYHRYTGSLGWSYDINPRWNINTKLRYVMSKMNNGSDPDEIAEKGWNNNKNQMFSLTHNGRMQVEKKFARTVNYTFGMTFNRIDNEQYASTSFDGSEMAILTARETGYYAVPVETRNYWATRYMESRPGNIFAKINDSFYFTWGKTRQTFKVGAEYHYDWNKGKGYYDADERYPLRPNSDGRPRAYSDIPGLHQIAAYAEDQFVWTMNKVNRLRATFGLRFTALQPFADVATSALSPRLNLSFSATKWLDIRAGIGMNSKTPGLNYLYPDKKYIDTKVTENSENGYKGYHTLVYDVQYTRNLKNATTTKAEFGLDFRLNNGKKLSILGYIDNTPNGFTNQTEYYTYVVNKYNTIADMQNSQNIKSADTYFITTGAFGNNAHTINRGIEFDMDFGTWKALRTSFYLSGALQESKSWNTDLNAKNPPSKLDNQSEFYSGTLYPFKVVYPNGKDDEYHKYRRIVTTLRTVTHIPELRMVASLTTQVVWHDWNHTYSMDKDPIGWIDTDAKYHGITSDMLAGYIGVDAKYYATAAEARAVNGDKYLGMYRLMTRSIDVDTESSPIVWNVQARITKEFGKIAGLSFYVNNALYYEPFLRNNSKSVTRTQHNTGFSFGAELYFNL